MNFAKRVFLWSGVYGVVTLLPMYFLEQRIGIEFPPATNHPEQYYAFIGVALAWQLVFLLIGPIRGTVYLLVRVAFQIGILFPDSRSSVLDEFRLNTQFPVSVYIR